MRVVAQRAVERDEQLDGERVGQAAGAVVVHRHREVLRDRDVGVTDDEDDLERHRDRRAVGAAGQRRRPR